MGETFYDLAYLLKMHIRVFAKYGGLSDRYAPEIQRRTKLLMKDIKNWMPEFGAQHQESDSEYWLDRYVDVVTKIIQEFYILLDPSTIEAGLTAIMCCEDYMFSDTVDPLNNDFYRVVDTYNSVPEGSLLGHDWIACDGVPVCERLAEGSRRRSRGKS